MPTISSLFDQLHGRKFETEQVTFSQSGTDRTTPPNALPEEGGLLNSISDQNFETYIDDFLALNQKSIVTLRDNPQTIEEFALYILGKYNRFAGLQTESFASFVLEIQKRVARAMRR